MSDYDPIVRMGPRRFRLPAATVERVDKLLPAIGRAIGARAPVTRSAAFVALALAGIVDGEDESATAEHVRLLIERGLRRVSASIGP